DHNGRVLDLGGLNGHPKPAGRHAHIWGHRAVGNDADEYVTRRKIAQHKPSVFIGRDYHAMGHHLDALERTEDGRRVRLMPLLAVTRRSPVDMSLNRTQGADW